LLYGADRAIDQLSDDVGMTGMALRLGSHMDQDLMQCHLATIAPPRHPTDRVKRQRLDRRIRMSPGLAIQPDDGLAGLCRQRPRLPSPLVLRPSRDSITRTPERFAEVPELTACQVLDQSQQVGPGRRQRTAGVVLGQPVELPQHRTASPLQVVKQVCLGVKDRHGGHRASHPAKPHRC
jgi:hypothetical protein